MPFDYSAGDPCGKSGISQMSDNVSGTIMISKTTTKRVAMAGKNQEDETSARMRPFTRTDRRQIKIVTNHVFARGAVERLNRRLSRWV